MIYMMDIIYLADNLVYKKQNLCRTIMLQPIFSSPIIDFVGISLQIIITWTLSIKRYSCNFDYPLNKGFNQGFPFLSQILIYSFFYINLQCM